MIHFLSSGNLARLLPAAFVLMTLSAPAMAEWKAASEEVAAAAKDPRIAAALAAVDAADAAWYAAEAVGDARVTADFHAFDGGKPFIRDGLLDMAKAHLAKGERAAFTIDELAVQLDCKTALATFTTQGSFDSAGRHQDATFLESAELGKEDGQWRLAFFHSTLVPPAPPAATTRK